MKLSIQEKTLIAFFTAMLICLAISISFGETPKGRPDYAWRVYYRTEEGYFAYTDLDAETVTDAVYAFGKHAPNAEIVSINRKSFTFCGLREQK